MSTGSPTEFMPAAATTKSITAGAASTNVSLPVQGTSGSRCVRVYNSTGVVVFIKFVGSSSGTAATTDVPIPPGAVEFFEVPADLTYAAGITAAGGGTVYFTEGEGM